MANNEFWDRLLQLTLLIVGFSVLNSLIVVVAPLLYFGENLNAFVRYAHWVGKFAFGIVIFIKLKKYGNALSIALLSTLIPLFGGLFFLLTVALNQRTDEGQPFEDDR